MSPLYLRNTAFFCCYLLLCIEIVEIFATRVVSGAPKQTDDPRTSRRTRMGRNLGAWTTTSGYDNEDGDDIVCWDTALNETRPGLRPSPDDSDETSITEDEAEEREFDALFDDYDSGRSERTTLRSECHTGLNFSVAAVEPPVDNTFASGKWYAFRMALSLNVSQVYLEDGTTPAGVLVPPNKVFLRIICCNTLKIGFCDPFVEAPPEPSSDEESLDNEESEPEASFKPTPGIADDPPDSPIINGRQVRDGHIVGDFLPWDVIDQGGGVVSSIVDVRFRIPPAAKGVYTVIGHAVLIFGPPGDSALVSLKVDVADILPQRQYTLQPPPTIQYITDSFKIAVGIILGIAGAFQAFLFCFVVRHRNHGVMKMAQAPFLAALAFFALTATACSAFYLPTRDIFCDIAYPTVLTSLSFMGSILIGRMWRLHMILSISMRISTVGTKRRRHIEKYFMSALSFLADWQTIFCFLRRRKPGERQESLSKQSLRKQVKDCHLLQLVIALTLPQIVVQVLTPILYPAELAIELNEEETIGRVQCECGTPWPEAVGWSLIGVAYLLAVIIAVVTRDLPSVLNETRGILNATWVSVIVVAIGSMIIILTNVEPTSPNIQAFVLIVMTLGITLPTCCYIVVPKVRRVWSGEKVVMSNLFASASSSSSARSSTPSTSGTAVETPVSSDNSGTQPPEVASELKAVEADRPKVLMKQGEPPPRRLELRLLTTKELISKISQQSAEGRQISRSEWEMLQELSGSLHSELNRIEFGWSEQEDVDSMAPEVREERDAIRALLSS